MIKYWEIDDRKVIHTRKIILEEIGLIDLQISSCFAKEQFRHYDEFMNASHMFGILQHASEFNIIKTNRYIEKKVKEKEDRIVQH